MLTGEQLGRAIKQAMQLKDVTPTKMAKHFGVKTPSVYGWIKEGRISKEKLPSLWSYFSDVVGPTHWGLEAWPSGGIPAPPIKGTDITEAYHAASAATRAAVDLLLLPARQRALVLSAAPPALAGGVDLIEQYAQAAQEIRKRA
ncbi:hypothetical protein [Xylella fastidiosa]|uniref:hypothetical protein n=1 Tax=Xylella fastidiosa TaxID=2371 RepID=UPI000765BB53|nr:hypothetical protein [Xylella fastidiosa]KXB22586.1 repressor [Xylella fastidiosa]